MVGKRAFTGAVGSARAAELEVVQFMLELSSEDTLRLNVLVNNVEAIRIEERTLTVFGLSAQGEAKVQLSPTGRREQYLRAVREFLSTCALGSPSGYPVHLNRWTRMGQARDTNLAKLLMLGEPEAISAVVCAPGLTEELARRAWWVDSTSENARRMLARECVVKSDMGRALASYLIEHLPFETESRVIIDTVRLVLQSGLIDADMRQQLWEKGRSQSIYRIGFLEAEPDNLPESVKAHEVFELLLPTLNDFSAKGNPFAVLLLRTLGSQGQTFLATCERVIQKLASQDATVALLNVMSGYFGLLRTSGESLQDVAQILEVSASALDEIPSAVEILAFRNQLRVQLLAMHALAHMDEAVVTPVFAQSSASGSLMRKKIEPAIHAVHEQITVLLGTHHE